PPRPRDSRPPQAPGDLLGDHPRPPVTQVMKRLPEVVAETGSTAPTRGRTLRQGCRAITRMTWLPHELDEGRKRALPEILLTDPGHVLPHTACELLVEEHLLEGC